MRLRTEAIVVAGVLLTLLTAAAPAHAAFGVTDANFSASVTDAVGDPVTQAGAHPFEGTTKFSFNTVPPLGIPDGNVKDVRVDLPPGLISNPEATPKCLDSQFPSCPANTRLGTETLTVGSTLFPIPSTVPIFNMVPDPGQVSRFAFNAPVFGETDIIGGLRDTGDFGLFFTIRDIPALATLLSSELTFWGVQSQHGGASDVPFLSLPTACSGQQTTTLTVRSWTGAVDTAESKTEDADGTPIGATDCDRLPFDPSISVTPGTTQADEPTGAAVNLHVPQSSRADTLATAHVKDVRVTLPEGMTINPAAANGLEACTDEQFAKGTHANNTCPAASRIGAVSIATPVLPDSLAGSVYLGRPVPDDPYRLFLEADGFGLIIKLAGSVQPNPQTGRLTATFANTPQVPFTDFTLDFDGGPGATLATPLACGTATTTSVLTPYSGRPDATPASAFTVDADGAGGACPPTPFKLGFAAGTADRHAAVFSPFTVTVNRDDRQNLLSRLSVRQPPGMLGVLASVPLCGEADAARGTCPSESRIGTSSVKSGAGPEPFALSGPVSLTGPYGGAPFGLAIAIRAVAGPFDLGTVVVRAAIHVDPADSHLTIDADPLPQILQGIPLRLREVSVVIDRPGFIFNPSSCDPLAIHGTLTAVDGAVQEADAPFQATGCADLPFTPSLSAVADGRTSLKQGAGLRVTLKQPRGQANVRSVSVRLPKRLNSRGTTVSGACLDTTFKAGLAGCASSLVGKVHAETPLLTAPLDGPVYLVGHSGALPTLEALMQGQGLNIDLSGTIKLDPAGLTSTFESVPDVPITSFVLDLPRGPHSALAASRGICGGALTMATTIVGQNGARIQRATPIKVTGCGLKILKARVRRSTVTLTVEVSRRGRLTGAGKGLRRAARNVTKGGHVQLRLRLSKRGRQLRASRHRAHRHLKVKVTVRLGALKARRTVRFR
jgi:hypothetical protein